MNTLRILLTKLGRVLPYVGIGIGLTNYSMAREAKAVRLQQLQSETIKLKEDLQAAQEMVINNQIAQTKISCLSTNASEHLDKAAKFNSFINELILRYNNPDTPVSEREYIKKALDSNIDEQVEALEKANISLQKILDTIFTDKNNLFSDLNQQLEVFIDNFKTYVSTLDVEQLNALINILSLIAILTSLLSIIGVLFGDYLIKNFNLENKYPKISKYIQLRQKFQ